MKALNQTLSFVALSVFVTLLAACGSNSNSISSDGNVPGAGAVGAGIDMKSCQVGQIYSTDYGCLSRSSCGSGTAGFSEQANRCVTGQYVTEELKFGRSSTTRHFGRLTITNESQMELMLQQAKLCNGMYSYNASNSTSRTPCATWIARGAFALVKSFAGSVHNINLTIGAGTQFPSDLVTILPGVYGSQVGLLNYGNYGSANYISFNQQAHNYSFNNDNGMQIVGVSPSNQAVSLMLLVSNGNLGNDHLTGQLVYQGVVVATLSLDRF